MLTSKQLTIDLLSQQTAIWYGTCFISVMQKYTFDMSLRGDMDNNVDAEEDN